MPFTSLFRVLAPAAGLGLLIAVVMLREPASGSQPQANNQAEQKSETVAFSGYKLDVPGAWQKEKPRNNIVDFEFSIKPAAGDDAGGRFTLMDASGSVEANLERWYGQFTQPDGSKTADKAKLEELELAGLKVHVVDMSGTFKDQAGPFAPATIRENYRMLAAIIPTKEGAWFAKFVGPAATVEKHAAAFQEMIKGLKQGN